ncbi:YcxB family protein [Micromonospora sp. PLK6-60]|uniref:YcxB family protein n=1 Tax=Micromonospora sp. PLK6-60 TaxID=2873383 RepID=UPI001CA6C3B4|nr:YcxB family protein [Micromonospora sp. PLK6-60]MBY8870975.1 YcxB family protein [Micromonospora sp. PLK6-60]
MAIEFTYQRDRAYARRLARSTSRRLRITYAGFGVVATGAGLGATIADPGWAVLFGLAGLGLGLVYLLTALMLPWQVVGRSPAARYQSYTYRIDDDGIAWLSASVRSWVSWSAFTRVTERRSCYLLWQDGGLAAWDIPRAPLTPEQDRWLAALLAERVRPGAARTAAGANAGEAGTP